MSRTSRQSIPTRSSSTSTCRRRPQSLRIAAITERANIVTPRSKLSKQLACSADALDPVHPSSSGGRFQRGGYFVHNLSGRVSLLLQVMNPVADSERNP